MIIYAVVTVMHGIDEPYIGSYHLSRESAQSLVDSLPNNEWEYSYVKEIEVV